MSETNGLVTKPMGMSPSIPDRRTKNLAEVQHPDLFHIPEDKGLFP